MRKKLGYRYWLALAVMAGLTALYGYERDIYGQYLNYQRSKSELRELRQKVQQRGEEERQASRRVELLQSDPVEREAAVRRTKKLLREGEHIYRLEPEPGPEASRLESDSDVRSGAAGQSEALATGERD